MDEIHDPRKQEQCTYGARHLLWLGIMMFVLRLGSRRQMLAERETAAFHSNLLDLAGTDEDAVAHTDTLNNFMEMIDPYEMEGVKVKMVKRLIAEKRLDPFRLSGEFLVAVDGTGIFSSGRQHCEHCLKTEHQPGFFTWSHKMLEAKLVAENGFALSVCSEPIENENGIYEKQDCELNAFYRMEKRLKKFFPRTPICLLLDGLYACKEVFSICGRNNWSFIVVFKEGSIPNLYAEAVAVRDSHPANSLAVCLDGGIRQEMSWAHSLLHEGHLVHAVFCSETDGKGGTTNWSWVTDIRPGSDNVEDLANKGGRQRWKIENQGFNEQKRHDFELEHLYGEDPNAWKNYYQLLQVAHIIIQLVIYGDLCQKLQKMLPGNERLPALSFLEYYRSVRNFIRRLCESFRNTVFSDLSRMIGGSIQIRFDTG